MGNSLGLYSAWTLLVLRVNQHNKSALDICFQVRFAVISQKGPVYPAATSWSIFLRTTIMLCFFPPGEMFCCFSGKMFNFSPVKLLTKVSLQKELPDSCGCSH